MHQNVDHQEIEKFAALAERWWDPEGEFKPLHQITPLRLDYIEQRVDGVFGKQVLDVGCGGGLVAEGLAQRGARVTGIDMAERSLAIAQLHALETGTQLAYHQSTAEAWAETHAGRYDVVTCLEMLEHVPEPSKVVAACARLVKPGGHVIFSTLNRNPKSYLFAIIGAEYLLKLLPPGTHTWGKFIRPSELLHWCDPVNLREQHMTGLHYNPLTQRYWLAPNVDVNYLVHTRLGDPI